MGLVFAPIPRLCPNQEVHLFGLVLLNDWSARKVQALGGYQPLGPFVSKNLAATISSWIVKPEALAPIRVPFERPPGDPAPLRHRESAANGTSDGSDITLEAALQSAAMCERGMPPLTRMRPNSRDSYRTPAQSFAHHSSDGCNLGPSDLPGSGAQPGQGGSLRDLTEGGRKPLSLPIGETRTFLADGDSIVLCASCERDRARRIGVGACEGHVLVSRAVQ